MFQDASIQELAQENELLKQKLSDAENNYIKDNHINELKSSNEKVCFINKKMFYYTKLIQL